MISHNKPVIFMGGGEGAAIVQKYDIGFTVTPNDYKSLSELINSINKNIINKFIENINLTKASFSFNNQEKELMIFLNK
jgi:hypothetical protein